MIPKMSNCQYNILARSPFSTFPCQVHYKMLNTSNGATCECSKVASSYLKDPPSLSDQVHTQVPSQTEKHRQVHTLTVPTPCRIIGQVHRGLKCTTAVFVEQNIMFPHYHTVEYGEPAQLALGGLDWRTGPSN